MLSDGCIVERQFRTSGSNTKVRFTCSLYDISEAPLEIIMVGLLMSLSR
jgi:hypothetical protein